MFFYSPVSKHLSRALWIPLFVSTTITNHITNANLITTSTNPSYIASKLCCYSTVIVSTNTFIWIAMCLLSVYCLCSERSNRKILAHFQWTCRNSVRWTNGKCSAIWRTKVSTLVLYPRYCKSSDMRSVFFMFADKGSVSHSIASVSYIDRFYGEVCDEFCVPSGHRFD